MAHGLDVIIDAAEMLRGRDGISGSHGGPWKRGKRRSPQVIMTASAEHGKYTYRRSKFGTGVPVKGRREPST